MHEPEPELHIEVVSRSARHLKWRALDPLERVLMWISGICLLGFTLSELGDVFFRIILHPWLNAQEFAITFFIWGAFLGGATAVRRDTHFKISAVVEKMQGRRRTFFEVLRRVVMLIVAVILVYQGYINYLSGFGSFMTPSGKPIAILYASIPVAGALIFIFVVEQLVNGFRNGYAPPQQAGRETAAILAEQALERGI